MNILDWIFPKRCVGCGRAGRYFCVRCVRDARPIFLSETICPVCEKPAVDGATHPHCRSRYCIDGLTSFFHYRGPIRSAVKSLKYRCVFDLAKEFVDLVPSSIFNEVTKQRRSDPAFLIPIPLHAMRLRERGFNQAEVLGKHIAARLNISMRTDVLMRVKKTIPQVAMKEKKKRLANMEGVFGIDPSSIRNSPLGNSLIILVDDVFTTGATMRSAAGVLKRAGATFVWGISMAR